MVARSRQAQWAKQARLKLIAELGGECVECGATRMWNSMMGWGEWIDGRSAHAIRREKELRNAES